MTYIRQDGVTRDLRNELTVTKKELADTQRKLRDVMLHGDRHRVQRGKAIAVTRLLQDLGLYEWTIHVADVGAHPQKLDAFASTWPGREGTYCLCLGATVEHPDTFEGMLLGDHSTEGEGGDKGGEGGGEEGMGGMGGGGKDGGERGRRGGKTRHRERRANLWSSQYNPTKKETTMEKVVMDAFQHHRNTNPTTDNRSREDSKSHLNLTVY